MNRRSLAADQLEDYLADERDWREANGMTAEEYDEWRTAEELTRGD
jgi:hypothetical protein